MLEANLRGGTGVIVAGPGVYTLGIPGADENFGHTGDLDVTGDLVIVGARADRTTFDGNGLDRVLDVRPGGSLELYGVTVSGGWARPDAGPFNPRGGGGIERVVWMPKALKEEIADRVKERLQKIGKEDLFDKIATEENAETAEQLVEFLQKVEHPALTLTALI